MGERWDKLHRHWRWGRDQGFGRLIEEDQLNPWHRWRTAAAKSAWRRRHRLPRGEATMLLAVGLQRSGTNMLVRGFEQAPEVEVHNENDRAAFDHYRLRADHKIADIVEASTQRFVLFKPLCDSHRTPRLLNLVAPHRGKAIWIFRSVDGRARSAVAKFGSANLDALREIAAGGGAQRWEAGGLTALDVELIRSMDVARLDPHSAAALFWYLRNQLFFTLALNTDPRVSLACYDDFLARPEATMRGLCTRIGFTYRPGLIAGIEPARSDPRMRLELAPPVRRLCDELTERLDHACRAMYQAR